ncbi:hypothetical protein LXA43DRAFT_1187824 [Ganoderma leucocontextum]|nr:hypothetical protein LXA43DRAFT_1187824 [Ganoderma leucocontextum]
MYKVAVNPSPHDKMLQVDGKYMAHVSIVQSSGSGKSRLVDEVAKKIFTIPFNIREQRAASGLAWPLADQRIRELLVGWAREFGGSLLHARYLCFFIAVFEETRKAAEQCVSQSSRANLPFTWRKYLENMKNRDALYATVASRTIKEVNIRSRNGDGLASALTPLQVTVREALCKLLRAVCTQSDCSSHPDNNVSSPVQQLHILIYFDEAHVLARPPPDAGSSSISKGKTALDVLFTVLDDFCRDGLFTLLLSTQLEYIAPPPSLARSACYRELALPYMHAPVTETPFDCFESPIIPSTLHAEDVWDIVFMACFGRPMWRSLLLPFINEVLGHISSASGSPQVLTPRSDRDRIERFSRGVFGGSSPGLLDWVLFPSLLALVLRHARTHSHPSIHGQFFPRASSVRAQVPLYERQLSLKRKDYSDAAQTAVLDVRIMLSFDSCRPAALCRERDLVASRMRTAYSIPRDHKYLHSGYSSEPILAEAAARQLGTWRISDPDEKMLEPAVQILRDHLSNGLLDRGERGETAGRLVLTLARDRAVLNAFPEDTHRTFSRPVTVIEFIKTLLSPALAQTVLNSRPDNLPSNHPESRTFENVFEHAVLNFTHFAKGTDDSALNEDTALGCFLRSMAAMTGILVQFKLRKKKGTKAAYEIDQKRVGLFRDGTPLCPYITLVMELGITSDQLPSESLPADPPVESSKADVHLDVGKPRGLTSGGHQKVVPPRYSMFVYGCSPEVYRVIGQQDMPAYKQIIDGGSVLAEHTRQDPASLRLIEMQKPFFCIGNQSWHWVVNDRLNESEFPDEEDGQSDDVAGARCNGYAISVTSTGPGRSHCEGLPWSLDKERQYRRYLHDVAIGAVARRVFDSPTYWENPVPHGEFEVYLRHTTQKVFNARTAYERLRPLQGKKIPTVYGVVEYEIAIPDACPDGSAVSETVPGLLLEYVPSLTLLELVATWTARSPPLPNRVLTALCEEAVRVVDRVSNFDVLNEDVRMDNFLIRRPFLASSSNGEDPDPAVVEDAVVLTEVSR